MKTKEYIKKYKLNISDKFNHSEFIKDLSVDFLSLLEVGRAQENLKGFENAVRAIRMKFDAINNKTVGFIPEKLWKYFFATVVVKFREKLFPEQMKQIKDERAKREKRYEERKKWEQQQFNAFDDMFFFSIIADLFKTKIPENSFNLLGLKSDASINDVKKQYRKLCLINHPDKNGDQNKFIEITDAKNKCLSFLASKCPVEGG
jgi:PhoPQ-activated pathogenicity-related protein